MKELTHKLKEKSVGADASVRPFFRGKPECNKGITLIALIITIIVMLILVSVTVTFTIGENGILSQAKQAKVEQDKATEQEELIIEAYATYGKEAKFDKAKFKVAVEEKGYTFDETTGKITTLKGYEFYVNEEGEITEEEPILSWDGTTKQEVEEENNTYYISNAAELAWVAEQVNGGNTFSGKIIKLTKNIDLGNKLWTPIGRAISMSDIKIFAGEFDGQGHVISNINATSSEYENDVALGGIFGVIQNATIQNLGIENGIIQAYGDEQGCTQIGGIVGVAVGTVEISNCYNKNVKITYKYGNWRRSGIVSYCMDGTAFGMDKTTLTIENCYNVTDIGEDGVGILAEIATGATANISNCYNVGKYDNKSTDIESGICAWSNESANIDNCYTVPFEDGKRPEIEGVTVLDLEEMKGIASNLGSAFKADTKNINGGYPILTWQ